VALPFALGAGQNNLNIVSGASVNLSSLTATGGTIGIGIDGALIRNTDDDIEVADLSVGTGSQANLPALAQAVSW